MKNWWAESTQIYKQQTGVSVEIVTQSLDAFIPAFRAAAAAKQGPDIQYLWEGAYVMEEVWAGRLVPLSDYWKKVDLFQLSLASGAIFEGKTYFAPRDISAMLMSWNKDLFRRAGLNPDRPPTTWEELLETCRKLKAAGIIPIAFGLKDKWGGGWLFSALQIQNLDSSTEIMQPVVTRTKFTDNKFATWWERLGELREFFNDDIMSLEVFRSREVFLRGQAAMAFGTRAHTARYISALGEDKVGVMQTVPTWARGKLAGRPIMTATGGYAITSFSQNKEEAAKFLKFMHSTDRVNALYRHAEYFPADKKFDTTLLPTPTERRMFDWIKVAVPWLEDWVPPQLSEQGIFDGVQMVVSGRGKVADAARLMEESAERWRTQNPAIVGKWRKWSQE